MPEIVKWCIIASAIKNIEDDGFAFKIGYNVLDQSDLNNALVLGLISHTPANVPISYSDMGNILNCHPQTAGAAVKRLEAAGKIGKEDYGSAGSLYEIAPPLDIPRWVLEFTRALLELHSDPDLRSRIEEECRKIEFKRGFGVLQQQIREKFYRRKKGG